jgi:hypothetical protein
MLHRVGDCRNSSGYPKLEDQSILPPPFIIANINLEPLADDLGRAPRATRRHEEELTNLIYLACARGQRLASGQ